MDNYQIAHFEQLYVCVVVLLGGIGHWEFLSQVMAEEEASWDQSLEEWLISEAWSAEIST